MLIGAVDDGHPAHLRRLQRFLRESHRVFVIFDDVDLLAAQFADNGLHAHALHTDARPHGVHVLVFGHDSDLGALASFAGDSTNDDGAVINLWNFGLEQMLHQLRYGARHHHARTLGSSFDARDHHAHALADGKRLQPGLLLARHARLRLADVKDYVRALNPLYRGVHNLAHAPDVFVVDRVPLGFADLLENHLLRQLRSDASQNTFGRFGNL